MHARDRRAAMAVIDKLSEILRRELGDDAHAMWPVLGALLQSHLSDRYTTITALGSGFSQDRGVAVDGSDNVFVADYGNSAVKEILDRFFYNGFE